MGILETCHGRHGTWADPTRYKYQCWIRDAGMAIFPLELDQGKPETVARHLRSVMARQRVDGQIPILFLDGIVGTVHFLVSKVWKSIRDRRPSFMLKRFLEGELGQLTPGTRDSELHFIIGVYEYGLRYGFIPGSREAATLAMWYICDNLLDANGLHVGCDWRDTMEKILGDKALLSNQALLYHCHVLMGNLEQAEDLRARVNDLYWVGNNLVDFPGESGERFDPLGASLAVLHGLIQPNRYEDVMRNFDSVDTAHGVTIRCKHNPVSADEGRVIEETNGVVVWPFIVGFTVLASLKMADHARHCEDASRWQGEYSRGLLSASRWQSFAYAQLRKLLALDGFREWYDPRSGLGYGAIQQLWSATLTARAYFASTICLDGE